MSSAGLRFACTTCEAVRVEEGPCSVHRRDVLQRDETSGAFFARAVRVYLLGGGGVAFPQIAHNFCASRVECGGYCFYHRPPTPFRRLLVLATSRSHRAESIPPLPGRPCPLYATKFHAAAQDRIAGEIMLMKRVISNCSTYNK